MERICETVADSNYEKIQHFISSSPWDYRAVMNQVAKNTTAAFRNFKRIGLVIDESGHGKKGNKRHNAYRTI